MYSALAAYWAGCIIAARKLPEKYPIHFNIRGEPDRWTSGSLEWFILPAIGTATVLLMPAVQRLAQRNPRYWNVPEKQRFLALSPQQRVPIMKELNTIIDATGVFIVVLFIVIQWIVFRSATTGTLQFSVVLYVTIFGGVAALLLYVLRLNARIGEMIRAASRANDVGRTS